MKSYIKELLENINNNTSQHKLNSIKSKLAKKYKLKKIPTNIEIIHHLTSKQKEKYKNTIKTKPVRTISGVAPLAIMTSPAKCPHGKCTYCPGGPNSTFGTTPQSYTGREPATMRAIRNNYDPYLQVFNRLEQYTLLNQTIEKIELIIMGGTFPARTIEYQDSFITFALKALNDFSDLFYKNNKFNLEKFKTFFELPGDKNNIKRTKSIQGKILKLKKTSNLKKEQLRNETSNIRAIAICIETRPDYGKLAHGNQMLRLGATRVELGIQSVYDDVLKKVKRGHTTKDSKDSIKILRNLGFKISTHYMLGLPLTPEKKDYQGIKILFKDYKPDMLKLYPCLLAKGTELYKDKKFKPLTTKRAIHLISKIKPLIPEYTRIQRIQRDIPSKHIEAGVLVTNLRQYIKNTNCRCIRCREIGHIKDLKDKNHHITISHYKASDGDEFFISAENKQALFGYCRLRFPSQQLRKEITKDSAIIREIHVYSSSIPLKQTSKDSIQHKGIGKKLLKTAERIAKSNKKNKMVVISGIGVREYFKKLNYKKQGPYMIKRI